ncbi:atp-binding protein [Pyrococcus sp. NA2]|uniref:ATP-binding protein n=1 Tax=Pyrococcus sp. (strain NA2) TaxID=342949 RepID=UPI000209AAF7|nr:ATP-binding protein [Pyrococcus sp. NA2]AEC52025.1 atp-binding protein [Pyrococcus sp. NA2]
MFFDRERELKWLLKFVSTEPNLITFIYGPINSGKSSLMVEFIKRLPEEYVTFYINLRGRFIRSEDFIKVLFSVKDGSLKDLLGELLRTGLSYGGIPVPERILKKLLEDENEDPFLFLENYFRSLVEKEKKPVLILDELQVIGDLKLDGPLIYRLFNFFVRLAKETHLSHVFLVTSDSLFIERIYNEAMLQGRAEYFLVDDFEREIALEFLRYQGLNDEEAELIWNYFGGKPVYLVEAPKHKDELRKWCERMLRLRVQSLNALIHGKRNLVNLLKKSEDNESIPFDGRIDRALKELIRANVLFIDPLNGIVRPQGRLELLAIREVLK